MEKGREIAQLMERQVRIEGGFKTGITKAHLVCEEKELKESTRSREGLKKISG